MAAVVLKATDVVKEYPSARGPAVRAVRGVSLELREASTHGIVGESGCGKSTLGRLLVGLEKPTAGRVELVGQLAGTVAGGVAGTGAGGEAGAGAGDRAGAGAGDRRGGQTGDEVGADGHGAGGGTSERDGAGPGGVGRAGTGRNGKPGGAALARRIQLVFQDPFSSLNPRLTVLAALNEVLAVHRVVPGRTERRARAYELLGMVALAPRFGDRYPHELSGGQAQRVAIARALAVGPRALVLDEPTSALDVSVRAEVMNLLTRLQDELSLSYVFISHDLAMVRHISDVISVMYLGKVVESGPYAAVLGAPLHPYTRALAEAVPLPDPELEANRKQAVPGEALSLYAEPEQGCPYHPRCPLAEEQCRARAPELLQLRPGHTVACHVAAREASVAGGLVAGLPGAAGPVPGTLPGSGTPVPGGPVPGGPVPGGPVPDGPVPGAPPGTATA
jgi:oligopeptide/dipeptide ABC transporter ATP-binding protein